MLYNERTIEAFREVYYKKYPNSDIEILEFSSRITTRKEKSYVIVKSKYGIHEVLKGNLLVGKIPTIESALNKPQYLENQIKELFPENLEKYRIINYDRKQKVIVETKYGECICTSGNLLKGVIPSIVCAINKEQYLTNNLLELFPEKSKLYEILEYKNQDYVILRTEYGLCKCNSFGLMIGKMPSIQVAIDKTEYFLNKVKEDYKSLYDFNDYEYIRNNVKSKLICPKHGEFFINPAHILKGVGCSKCGDEKVGISNSENPAGWNKNNWYNSALNSKQFDSFKVYILRCWNDEEEFYKIGRTFLPVKRRFCSKKRMPYSYEIVKTIEFKEITKENCNLCYDLETRLKSENKRNKYIPMIYFEGRQECFKQINI